MRHRPAARLLSLVVLAAVIASGFVGQAASVASALGDAGPAATGVGGAPARVVPPAGVWRPVAQDEDAPAATSDCDVRGIVESPTEAATVPSGPLTITGWAADMGSTSGTGIDQVRVSLDADPDQGGVPVSATYGADRPDIADLLGDPRYTASGFTLAWDSSTTPAGPHVLYVQVHSACGWTGTSRSVVVAGGAQPTAAAGATTVVPTVTQGTTTPTPTGTSGLVFPTVPILTPTAGSPGPAAAAGTPGAAATVPLTTATIAPSPTGSIPAPTGVTAAINPTDGSLSIQWTAPAAMVREYIIVTNEADGSQRTVREVPGSATRAMVGGLDPRIGYSLSVIAIDSLGRKGAPSAAVSTSGAPTVTPIPSPTLSPYCTPIPYGPPQCPPPGWPAGVPYTGAPYAGGAGCGAPGPYGVSGPYGATGPYGPSVPFGAPGAYGQPYPPYGAPGAAPYGQPGCVGGAYPGGAYPGGVYPGGAYPGGVYPGGAYPGVGGSFTLTATLVNGNTAQLTWGTVPGATTYNVLQGINGQPPTQQVQSAGLSTTASIPIQPGTTYTFSVQAMGANGVQIATSNPAPLSGTGIVNPVVPGAVGCGGVGQGCASRSTAVPSVPSAPAATGMNIQVTVLDVNGTPVAGAPVTIVPSSGNGQALTPSTTSGPGGIATFFVRGTGPGPATFTITIAGQPLPAPVTVTFT